MNDAKATIVGYVTKEPRLIENDEGGLFIMNVAVCTKRKDEYDRSIPNFYHVTTLGKQTELLAQKVRKGTRIWACGDLFSEARVKDNVPYTRVCLEASDVKVLSGFKEDPVETTEE